MSEHIKEIAQRLKAVRELSSVSIDELQPHLSISKEEYIAMESGNVEIPVSVLCEVAAYFNVSITDILTGIPAKLHTYSVTRKNKGLGIERVPGYSYQSLAYNFIDRKVEPLMVTIPPASENPELHMNSHHGHEFHYCINGTVNVYIDKHVVTLSEGDSLYFDSQYPHSMSSIGDTESQLLVIVIP